MKGVEGKKSEASNALFEGIVTEKEARAVAIGEGK